MGNLGAGHDPCAKVGENHRRSTATNVIEHEEDCKNWTLFIYERSY